MLDTDSDSSEDKAITALGILNTMETILTVMEEQKEVGMMDTEMENYGALVAHEPLNFA